MYPEYFGIHDDFQTNDLLEGYFKNIVRNNAK